MTQPATEIVELAIASCSTCDQLFLVSPRRGTCPTCGGEPGLIFFEFVGDQAGLHLKSAVPADLPPAASAPPFGVPEAAAEREAVPAAAPGPEPAVPIEEPAIPEASAPPPPPGGTVENYLRRVVEVVELTAAQLEEEEPDWIPLRAQLGALGAEEEEISTAVGRLDAVRNLIHDLAARGLGDVRPEPPE